MGAQWRVLVKHDYDQADFDDPRVGAHIWVRDSADKKSLVAITEVLPTAPPDGPQYVGTIIAEPLNQ